MHNTRHNALTDDLNSSTIELSGEPDFQPKMHQKHFVGLHQNTHIVLSKT